MAKMIDLSRVPVPDVITPLDFEAIFTRLKGQLIALAPAYAQVLQLESEPLTKFVQLQAFQELHLTARINDATRGNMLASAKGKDLEAAAARYNIARLTVQAAQPLAIPPVAAIMEEDDALRRRTQMAFDGLNTAGSLDAYVFFALGSDGRVRDAAAYSPAPCEMVLTILSHEGDGTPGEALLGKVRDYFGLSADGLSQSPQPSKVRPQGDRLIVQGASIIAYQVSAELTIEPGPDAQIIIASAQAALDQYCTEQHRLGADITLSGLYQALHRPGVSDVKLLSPASSLSVDEQSAAWCSASTITGVADE